MVVGIFSFSKLLMHRDLDPDNWPQARNITDHPLLLGLLGDGLSEEPHYGDDVEVDAVTDPGQKYTASANLTAPSITPD